MDAMLRLYFAMAIIETAIAGISSKITFDRSRSLGAPLRVESYVDHLGADSRISELVLNADAHFGELQHQCFKLECLGTLTSGLPPNASFDLASAACAFCSPTVNETTRGNAAALRPARTARREVLGNFPDVLTSSFSSSCRIASSASSSVTLGSKERRISAVTLDECRRSDACIPGSAGSRIQCDVPFRCWS